MKSSYGKRFLWVPAVMLLISLFALSACSSKSLPSEGTADGNVSAELEEGSTNNSVSENGSEEVDDFSDIAPGTIAIREQILFDIGGIKVTAKSFEKDENDLTPGGKLYLYLENNNVEDSIVSEDVFVEMKWLAVNGYMINTVWGTYLDAGDKIDDDVRLSHMYMPDLRDAEINEIGTIDMQFDIMANNELQFTTDPITIKTSAYNRMDGALATGKPIFDEGGISISYSSIEENARGQAVVSMLIENNTDKAVWNHLDSGFLNDTDVRLSRGEDIIQPHMKRVDCIGYGDLVDTPVREVKLEYRFIEELSYEPLVTTGPLTFSIP